MLGFKSAGIRKGFSQCMQRPTTRSTSNVNVTEPRQFVADQAANAHKRPSLADIRRHRDWRYRALLEAILLYPRVRLKYWLRPRTPA
jgi:hypothetical protein